MSNLMPGDRAPDFTATSHDGATVRLSDFLGQQPVVLFFYPKDFTPGCTAQVCTFRDAEDGFAEAGAAVIGISADDGASHRRFAEQYALPYALLSDADGQLRKAYGVRKRWGLLAGRVTFVIDSEGFVRHICDADLRVQRHSEEALKVVRLLQAENALP